MRQNDVNKHVGNSAWHHHQLTIEEQMIDKVLQKAIRITLVIVVVLCVAVYVTSR
jgi:hypothetical protein